jgi:hypothetical protein
MRFAVTGICAALAAWFLLGTGTFQAGEGEKPKYTIKQVMKMAHGGAADSLRARVLSGKANEEDKMKLVELYASLSKNKPPQGAPEAWKKQTESMHMLAQAGAKGDEAALKKLSEITTCKVCHAQFKGG